MRSSRDLTEGYVRRHAAVAHSAAIALNLLYDAATAEEQGEPRSGIYERALGRIHEADPCIETVVGFALSAQPAILAKHRLQIAVQLAEQHARRRTSIERK